jgi:hypothetical protein
MQGKRSQEGSEENGGRAGEGIECAAGGETRGIRARAKEIRASGAEQARRRSFIGSGKGRGSGGGMGKRGRVRR